MFREDFEFHDRAAPSHLGRSGGKAERSKPTLEIPQVPAVNGPVWADAAEKELGKVPFFVRGKARRNTENFARERGLNQITVDTLYDAKAHFRN
jgi:light-independent protochlorophyllide reductase subunit B